MVSLLPGSRLGRYQVVEQIGRGGMATVFRAHDPDLNRNVAIKVLPSFRSEDPTFVDRFRQEAQAVGMLNHPNIIQVHDFGEDKGFSYIVMEYVTGGTLQDRMGRRHRLEEVLEVMVPLAEALEYAHGQGVIHRDIKPLNVLMEPDGRPKLTDFGLARILEGSAGLTGTNAILGTPEYMAPEQALGRPASARSDIYALGIIIYHMVLGRTPFRGDTPSEILMAHIHQPVPAPSSLDPNVDPRVEANLIRALAKDSVERHESPTELIEALATASAGSEGETGPKRGPQDVIDTQASTPTVVGEISEEEKPDRIETTRTLADRPISADQAGVLAIRHAGENADYYGPRYVNRELAWQVVSTEETENYYAIKLSYRPARQFFGKPGMELFTIDKTGAIELRQILDEPVPGFRQLINEQVEVRGVRFPLVGVAIFIVVGVLAGGLLVSGAATSEPETTPEASPEATDSRGIAALEPTGLPATPTEGGVAPSPSAQVGSTSPERSKPDTLVPTPTIAGGTAGLLRAGSISGRVTDAATGQPIADVFIVAEAESSASTSTDPDGRYTLPGLLPGSYVVDADARDRGYYLKCYNDQARCDKADKVSVDAGANIGDIDFRLEIGGTISGRVTDAQSGLAVADAEILATFFDSGEQGASARTGPDGRYTIRGVPPDSHRVRAGLSDLGYVDESYDGKRSGDDAGIITLAGAESIEGIDFQADLGATISGRVRDASTGLVIPGMEVRAQLSSTGEYLAEVVTGPTGDYTLTGLPAGVIEVIVGGPGYVPQTRTVSVAAGATVAGFDF